MEQQFSGFRLNEEINAESPNRPIEKNRKLFTDQKKCEKFISGVASHTSDIIKKESLSKSKFHQRESNNNVSEPSSSEVAFSDVYSMASRATNK